MIISNDGPRIVSTDYWSTEHSRGGIFYLSINAGCFRLLVPPQHAAAVDEMRAAEHIVISMLPRARWRDGQIAVEWLAEDGTDDPWSCHLYPVQVDRIPRPEDELPTWEARVYTETNSETSEALLLPAYLRWVEQLPCLEPLADTIRRNTKGTQ